MLDPKFRQVLLKYLFIVNLELPNNITMYNVCSFYSKIYDLQIIAALVANLGRITGGYNVAMSGLMLGQFKEPESDIKLSIYEGSWFGKPTCFK